MKEVAILLPKIPLMSPFIFEHIRMLSERSGLTLEKLTPAQSEHRHSNWIPVADP